MRNRDDIFVDKPEQKFFYLIALTKCADSPNGATPIPYYRDDSVGNNPITCSKISKTQMLKFLAYLGDIYEPRDLVVEINGTRLLKLWVNDDKWEMYSSLSGDFPDQYRGILIKLENCSPSE